MVFSFLEVVLLATAVLALRLGVAGVGASAAVAEGVCSSELKWSWLE